MVDYVCAFTYSSGLCFALYRWAGVGEARGDYPFSHHKLTVQFFEASAAQDRKLESLVHKAIQELWSPDPSELMLLLTRGIDSAFLKVPPSACTLSGSSDPCFVEAYHLSDSVDGRVTLHLKVPSSSLEVASSHIAVLFFMQNVVYIRVALELLHHFY